MTEEEIASCFSRWLRDHSGIIYRVVRAFASLDDQDDLIQDVLLNLWLSIPRFRGDSKESTWIYRIAINTSLAWRRGERRRSRKLSSLSMQEWESTVSSFRKGTSDQYDRIDEVYRSIRKLPKVDAALILMHLDGLSYQQISEVVGISANNVGVKLTRIRHELAQTFKDHHDEY